VSGWIKINKGLPDTIKFRRVVRSLKTSNALRGVTDVSEAAYITLVFGAIVRLWVYADTHISDDDTLAVSIDEIDDIVGVQGFAQALPAEWLHVIDAQHVQLPDFLAHNGSSEKQRRANAKRQADYRHRHSQRNVTRYVTSDNTRNDARPDQTRPDKTRPEEEPRDVADATAVCRVFGHWQTEYLKPRAKLDAKRKRVIREGLAKYSEADLCQAISGYKNSPHHMGHNDRNTVYDDIELFLRDAKHIDAGLRFYAEPPRTDLSEKSRKIASQTENWIPPEMRSAAN
jgi:hypothetical protein